MQVNAKLQRAGRKGAKVANRRKPGDAAKASKMSRKVAKKIPTKTRKRAAKKAAQTRKRRAAQ